MKTSLRSLGILSLLLASALPAVASANVSAIPAFYDFGPVAPGRTVGTTIVFLNQSPLPVQFFNVSCGGDLSVFRCFSNCFSLPAYGSCSVQVGFSPRNGDDLRKTVWLNGNGSGVFTSATVSGTDRKAPPTGVPVADPSPTQR